MLDCLITGGTVVDGTGSPGRAAAVGVRDGRIVAMGDVDERARRTIDAAGLVVAPGFVDIHTHYDAQLFWDSTASPSPLHGVTTVIGGNCGFTVAPLATTEADYLLRMLARVEGMPVAALTAGLDWDWSSFGEWLGRLDGRLGPNAGFLVGHSALRRVVMGEAGSSAPATEEQLAAMERLLAEALEAGGMGFSSSRAGSHNDGDGQPVPSRAAAREEYVRLSAVAGRYPGTQLEFIPSNDRFTEDDMDLMAEMSRAANRPLNWNTLRADGDADHAEHQLSASDWAAARGGRVVALTFPDASRFRMTLDSGVGFDMIPGWAPVVNQPTADLLRALREPEVRRRLREGVAAVQPGTRAANLVQFENWSVAETFAAETKPLVGRTLGAIAAERGTDALEVLFDTVVADGCRARLEWPVSADDEASWKERASFWSDPRTIVGASDAGAHLDLMCGATYTTTLVGPCVRDRRLVSLEEAVRLLTSAPARFYGIRDRGVLREGAAADVVVFDPERVAPGEVLSRTDLPGGATRLYADAVGVEHVLVNGEELVRAGAFVEARPGRVLRSGADTETVPAR